MNAHISMLILIFCFPCLQERALSLTEAEMWLEEYLRKGEAGRVKGRVSGKMSTYVLGRGR